MRFVYEESFQNYQIAIASGMMQMEINHREGKLVTLRGGRKVTEFINCSYLGLDLHPKVVEAYKSLPNEWGVNFCCARSRFSIDPLRALEEALSKHFGGRAITFPSVTSTHMSVLPLIASGILLDEKHPPKVCLIFDKLAHASMQYLKPILAQEARVEEIPHNDLGALHDSVLRARSLGEVPVYVADGVYSMGGLCPIPQLLNMADKLDFYLYIDDAHGTSIFGERGEGAVLSRIPGEFPKRLFLTFSMTKGFGVAGGGILMAGANQERLVRCYGLSYAFSAPLEFSAIPACMAALSLHKDGTVQRLQSTLRARVALFDELVGNEEPFSPIRMVHIGNESDAITVAKRVCDLEYFVSVAFFPVVQRGSAQLRICLSSDHTEKDIRGLVNAIQTAVMELESARSKP